MTICIISWAHATTEVSHVNDSREHAALSRGSKSVKDDIHLQHETEGSRPLATLVLPVEVG